MDLASAMLWRAVLIIFIVAALVTINIKMRAKLRQNHSPLKTNLISLSAVFVLGMIIWVSLELIFG